MHHETANQPLPFLHWNPNDLPAALAYLVLHAPNPVLLISSKQEGLINFANPSFLKLTGFNKEEICNEPVSRLLNILQPSPAAAEQSGADPNTSQVNLLTKDHRLITSAATMLPVSGDSSDKQLIYLQPTAANNEQDRMDYIAMVSHELKTPVTTAKGYAQLLLSMLRSGKPVAESLLNDSLSRLHYQIERLSGLVRSLLEDADLGRGNTGFTPDAVSLDSLLQEVVRDLQFVNPGRVIRLSAATAVYVMADRNKLEQVIINLVNNALKFSHDDCPVAITLEVLPGECRLTVSDQGVGIPVSEQPKIFERFYRSPGKGVRGEKGFGLGLFFVKEIVKLHGGTVALESEAGKGSTFSIHLPVIQP